MYPKETQENFIRLRASGKTVRAAAAELQIDPDTARNWNIQSAPAIDAARRDQLEAVLNDVDAVRVLRVKALAGAFKKLESYIERTDALRYDAKVVRLLLRLDRYLDVDNLAGEPAPGPESGDGSEEPETVLVVTPMARYRPDRSAVCPQPGPNDPAEQSPDALSSLS